MKHANTHQSARNHAILIILLIVSQITYAQNTYYSYKDIHLWDGNWHNENTWTASENGEDMTLPSVTLKDGDRLIITENTTVRLFKNVTTSDLSIEIRKGGRLITGTLEFASKLKELTGEGELIIKKNYFPEITENNTFGGIQGGSIIMELDQENGEMFLSEHLQTANNLLITFKGSENLNLKIKNDLTIAGDLSIEALSEVAPFSVQLSGVSKSIRLHVDGNMKIGRNVSLGVDQNNQIHEVFLGGDIVADGNILLTNSSQYQTSENGAAVVTMAGQSHNVIKGSGDQFGFYRLILDKGEDQTYMLDVQHPGFKLYYRTNLSNTGSDPNPEIRKALWIKNGTLRLGEGIEIEELTSGGHDFFIPLNGSLWIDGATVYTTRNKSNNSAITVLGTLRITNGMLDTRTSAGVIFRGTSNILIEGGLLRATQLRPSNSSGNHQLSWTQTGGVVDIDGENGGNSSYPRFSIPLSTQAFSMSGGTLIVRKPLSPNKGIAIGVSESNFHVSGGNIQIYIPQNSTFGLSSTAPFHNLEVFADSNGKMELADISHKHGVSKAQNLIVSNHLTLHENAIFDANGNDLLLGGHLTIKANACYLHGENTTRFEYMSGDNGIKTSILDIHKDYTFTTFHTIINKVRESDQKSGNVDIRKNNREDNTVVWVAEGDLTHYGKRSKIHFNNLDIELRGNVTIDKMGTWDAQVWNNTTVRIKGNQHQTLQIENLRHNVNNRFLNFILDNPAGYTSTDDFKVNKMELKSGVLDMGSYMLYANVPLKGAFDASTMVKTNGLAGDGGYKTKIKKQNISPDDPFIFPLGTDSEYTPVTITPASEGYISNHNNFIIVYPVNKKHHSVEGEVLQYYWNISVESAEDSNLNEHEFELHLQSSAAHVGGNDKNYRTAVISNTSNSWDVIKTYDNKTKTLHYGPVSLTTYEITAGNNSHFNGQGNLSPVFTSAGSGEWTDQNTWTKTGGGPDKYPQEGSIVEITNEHIVTVSNNNQRAETIKIQNGATLDLAGSTGHIFESFSGKGKLRLSSPNLPVNSRGNHDNLEVFHHNNGGDIEYYGESFTLPESFRNYNNLTICGNGKNGEPVIITLAPGKTHVQGELKIRQFATLSTNPDTKGVLTINGMFHFSRDQYSADPYNRFLFSGNQPWTVEVNNEIRFGETALIETRKNAVPVTHTIVFHKNLNHGRGKIDLYGDGTAKADMIIRSGNDFGFGSGQYGGTWRLNRLVVDFSDPAHSLTIKRKIEFPAEDIDQPIQLKKGNLILSKRSQEHPYTKDIALSRRGDGFHIPSGSALIVEGNNKVRTLSNTGIQLDGTLILREEAQMLMGYETTAEEQPQQNSKCNIVYGTSSTALVEIQDHAALYLTGQFRRNLTNENASVKYRQTGKSVVVAGTGTPEATERATLEILNSKSEFVLAPNASITIANGASSGYPALLIEAETYNIEGTIVIGNEHTLPAQQMGIRMTPVLGDLVISAHNMPVVYLHTFKLNLRNNLTIGNGAVFQTRGKDISIGGNITNNGAFECENSETVLLNGNHQYISGIGITTLHDLHIDAITGLSLQQSLEITGDMTLKRGRINDKGNVMTVLGNILMTGDHTSNTDEGGILMTGDQEQQISGYGKFGRLLIDKDGQVNAKGNIRIKQELMLSNGILHMSQHGLVIEENASISTITSFHENCMITTGGNLGDGGITKIFSAQDLQNNAWYFPLGTDNNFTGAEITGLTEFTAGKSITIFPVKEYHPSISEAFEECDPDKVLQYYWGLETDLDHNDIFAGNLVFHYQKDHCAGNTENYLSAQLRPFKDDSWAKLDAGINIDDQTITFSHTEGVNNSVLSGYYTAGEETAIPSNVPRFIATQNGNWESGYIWNLTQTVPPSGVIVEIPENVSVRISENMKRVYKTIINGHLIIEEGTTFHNLGFVEGNGTLEVRGTGIENPINLPNGRYEDFNTPGSTSTIIFGGNAGILPASRVTYNNLVIAGTGNKIMPLAQNITIHGDLTIQKNAYLQTSGNQALEIAGDLTLEADAGLISHASQALFIMNGEHPQTISGNFTSQTFKNQNNSISRLRIQNPQNVILEGEGMEITNRLYIDRGILINANSRLILSSDAPGAMANYSKEHFIEGTLTRSLPANSAQSYVFPVAQNHKPRFIAVEPENSAAGNWTAQFFDQETSLGGMDHENLDGELAKITNSEYWSLEGPVNGKAFVSLHWGPETAVSLLDEHLTTLLVAEWDANDQQWISRGMTEYEITGNGYGVITSNLVNFSKKYFSIGASEANNPLPVELLEFKAQAGNKQVYVNWKTATEINNSHFTVERSTNGMDYQTIDVVTSKAENGNSNQVLAYEIIDKNPLEGKSYYRLKQTDFDGTTEYSDPVHVTLNKSYEESFSVFPNPANGQSFQISLTGTRAFENIELIIFDMYGRKVYATTRTSDDNGNFMQTINIDRNFRSGMYVVSLHASSEKYAQKLMIK